MGTRIFDAEMLEGQWSPLWQVLTVPARVLSLRVNAYGFCSRSGRRFDRAQQPHASLVRESTACGRYAGNTITVSSTRPPWSPPQKKTLNMTVTQNEIEIMIMMILWVSKLYTNHINHVKCKLYKRVFSNTSSSCANSMQQYLL